MSKTFDVILTSYKVEKELEVNYWIGKTPYLNFGEGYEVCPIFPFCGAQARILVRKVGTNCKASIYFDTHGVLGCMDVPYWEVMIGDTNRFLLDETKQMVSFIKKELTKCSKVKWFRSLKKNLLSVLK